MRFVDTSPLWLALAALLGPACASSPASVADAPPPTTTRSSAPSDSAATSSPSTLATAPDTTNGSPAPADRPNHELVPAAATATTTAASSPAPSPSPAPTAAPSSGPGACPADMKLVEGDYCTDVEHKCLVEWFAPQNNKVVCEQFEPKATCKGKRVRKRFCIDTYEWPNQKGVRPEVMNHFYQAQVKCAAVGKRMCTESEWNFACEGPEMKPFPYGWVRDPRKCNGDHGWDGPNMEKVRQRDPAELARLWRGVPSGSQPDCISDFGVADMPANADEVVAGENPKAEFSSVNTGGPWYSGVRNQCRPKVYTHEEGFYYYYLSFRCCSEADGKPNEPRTPKQVREGLSWKSVEGLARFSVAAMQEKLEQKRRGECSCGPKEILCKTMCGTLLGPGATDGSDATRVLNKKRDKIKP